MYLIESVSGEEHLATEGEGRYEFGNNEEVDVEIGFEDLGVELLHLVEVCALVELCKLLLEELSSGKPRWGSNWDAAHLHGFTRKNGRRKIFSHALSCFAQKETTHNKISNLNKQKENPKTFSI